MENNWDELSRLNGLQAVIDPHDEKGSKNWLIDLMHWSAFRRHLKSSKNILDFGCGTGRYARRIEAIGKSYTGIDTSLGMIRKGIQINGPKYFRHFEGTRIPYPSNSFDTVITSEVLTYILKTPAGQIALSEIHRVLAPNGRWIMIEQASISGRKSESATAILVINDYIEALSNYFKVERLYKVRSPDFSQWTCKFIESQKVSLSTFKCIAPCLAKYETWLVNKAPESYFKSTSYYEFLIEASIIKAG